LELNHKARDAFNEFIKNDPNQTIEQAFMNYYKSRQITKDITKRMDEIKIRQEGSGYGYDLCVYYMAKDWMLSYEYAALLVFTEKLGDKLAEMARSKAEQSQKQTLKSLIKEAIKEAQKEEKKPKRTTKISN
jgi:cation transport ATPase